MNYLYDTCISLFGDIFIDLDINLYDVIENIIYIFLKKFKLLIF